jgi:RNA polymerase sigma-70 factor (ECF subfamily)
VKDQESGIASMYAAEFTPVSRTVFLILHDRQRAEDITQDAFIQLYSHWGRVSRYERPGAWVRRVAIRLAIRHQNRERIRAVLEDEPGDAGFGRYSLAAAGRHGR